jgi:hypothetical protein
MSMSMKMLKNFRIQSLNIFPIHGIEQGKLWLTNQLTNG